MINRVKPGLIILLTIFALVYVSEAKAVGVKRGINVSGNWAASGTWEGNDWESPWSISQKGKRIRGYAYGTIPFKGRVKGSKIRIYFPSGCKPVYTGTISNNSMSGTFTTKDCPDKGTWKATKVSNAPESIDVSASGSGE